MTDRELLERAAKAAGIDGGKYENTYFAIVIRRDNNGVAQLVWNPLSSDGDALRLAVRLNLNLYLSDTGHIEVDGISTLREEFGTGDPYAATRRAIVRAATAMAE